MIEILEGFPDNVVALAAKGQVTKADYDTVLTPAVDRAIERFGKIRCYYEIGGDFGSMDVGAAWEDFKLGVGHLLAWERVAVVTDVEWIRVATAVFRFLIPGQIRTFATAEAASARSWVTEA